MPFDLLLGRKTFDIWAKFWPQHGEIWPAVNTATKYVASNTMILTNGSHQYFKRRYCGKITQIKKQKGRFARLWKRKSGSDAPQA